METEFTRVTVGDGCRVVIPAPLRGRIGATPGRQLLLRATPAGLLLSTLDQAVADAQAAVAHHLPPDADLQADLRALRRHDPAVA